MTHLLTTLHLLALTVRDTAGRVHARAAGPQNHRDAGLSTLEVVVIALGLFLIAGVLVAAITAAVNNRLGQLT